MADKQKEVERVMEILKYLEPIGTKQYGLDKNEREELAKYLVNNGIRSAGGFQIEYDYDHNGVDYVDCSTIIPKEYEDGR